MPSLSFISCLRLEIYGSGHVYTFPQLLELYGKVNCENRTLPSKHSSWWRRTEDVLKMSWRRLQCNIFLSFKTSSKRLQDVFKKTCCKHVLRTSWRRLENVLKISCEDVLKTFLEDVLQICLQEVFKTSSKTKDVTLKKSWRRLEDVLENKKYLLGCVWNLHSADLCWCIYYIF